MWTWQRISNKFWSPNDTTWADIGSRPNINYADYKDLLWSLPVAIVLFTIKYCCEKYIFNAIGHSKLGIKSTRCSGKRPIPNRILEQTYIKRSLLDQKTLTGLTKQVDTMTQREIERWWRLRQAQDKPTTLRKFCESSWRCLYYTCSFSFGLFVLWDKPWLWDFEHFWLDYPHHSLDSRVWQYMIVSLSFYLTLTASHFVNVKRKDFWMMLAHHIATILAISLSWIGRFHRIGSLVLLYHDIADIFMEAAKMAKYAKYHKICDVITLIFGLVWMVSRMILYPQLVYCCVQESLKESFQFEKATMVSYVLVGLIMLLQCMHIVWTYMILQFACKALKVGGVKNDYRSSDESDSGSGSNDDSGCEILDNVSNRKCDKLHLE